MASFRRAEHSALVKVVTLKNFLRNPRQGGGAEDRRVLANIEAFVGRHADIFLYEITTKLLHLRISACADRAEASLPVVWLCWSSNNPKEM